ncbi:hypothetical protein LTR91_003593 [Friedmanniomyces endolithicus]|uniref:NDT80 domain-containing protein n=1 Tax=Friedmanniomyces endolithicus TaxID=329885 RepID=A0AAN6QZP2_9PEZI|nr:hypothetical protein LTS00_007596 [Friedmanniomyces endolithicus]KAK0938882.1 hypothetical protein LTR29_009492 [Friedmanniomyces endolithicus]KAK1006983.1 hypothetical protein LTR91_003593 [Friedmanniomyces endolithicus]
MPWRTAWALLSSGSSCNDVLHDRARGSVCTAPGKLVTNGTQQGCHSQSITRRAASVYQATNPFADSGVGSISTSPSSAASSLVYPHYQTNHYTSLSSFAGPVQHPQSFVPSTYPGARVPPILDAGPCMLPPPARTSIPTVIDSADRREAYVSSATPYLARNPLSPITHPGFGNCPDTPRSVLSGVGPSYSPSLVGGYGASQMASSAGYGTMPGESLNFPWPALEVVGDMTCEGQTVTPEVHAKVEKGFFLSTVDNKWTCYRRNYFSVTCHFELHPTITNGRMYLKRKNASEQIQAMGMRLSSAVDGSGGKSIELVQHTPKRDAGPKSKIEIVKVSPTPSPGRGEHSLSPNGIYTVPMSTFHATGAAQGPFLPMQNSGEMNGLASPNLAAPQLSSQYRYNSGPSTTSHLQIPGQHTQHVFDRVQFKQATANNGKRRASQQYFHLIVELFADVRKDGTDTPNWVKVAQRVSEKIVVRGRSPSHYQNEGQHGQAGRGGSASGSSGYSTASGTYGSSSNAGAFRGTSGYASNFGGGGASAGGGGGGGYRATQYAMHPAASDGSGDSSPGSVVDEGAVLDSERPLDAVMSDAERASIQDYDGYQYYPASMYEAIPHHQQQPLPPMAMAKIEDGSYGTAESMGRQYAVKTEYADAVPGAQWSLGGCGRFQGVESSRGFFPDLSTAGYT